MSIQLIFSLVNFLELFNRDNEIVSKTFGIKTFWAWGDNDSVHKLNWYKFHKNGLSHKKFVKLECKLSILKK
jgi:hypothetical protein